MTLDDLIQRCAAAEVAHGEAVQAAKAARDAAKAAEQVVQDAATAWSQAINTLQDQVDDAVTAQVAARKAASASGTSPAPAMPPGA